MGIAMVITLKFRMYMDYTWIIHGYTSYGCGSISILYVYIYINNMHVGIYIIIYIYTRIIIHL